MESTSVDLRLFALDSRVMLAAVLALTPFVFLCHDVGRLSGRGLLGAYGVYKMLVFGEDCGVIIDQHFTFEEGGL